MVASGGGLIRALDASSRLCRNVLAFSAIYSWRPIKFFLLLKVRTCKLRVQAFNWSMGHAERTTFAEHGVAAQSLTRLTMAEATTGGKDETLFDVLIPA